MILKFLQKNRKRKFPTALNKNKNYIIEFKYYTEIFQNF